MTIASQTGIEIHGNLMGDLITPLDPMRTLIKLDKDSVYQRVYTKTISGIISPNGKFLKPC